MSVLRTPKNQIAVTLLLIFVTATLTIWSLQPIVTLAIAVFSTVAADLTCTLLGKKPLFFPSAAIVTGLIIALLTAPGLPWYDVTIAGAIAMLSKNFIRIAGRQVFNPAGVGIFASASLFQHDVSWWAVSFQQFRIENTELIPYFLILLSPALISIYRMRRHRIILSFFVVYVALNKLVNPQALITNLLSDPTVIFFSLVMLPEPMTTPNRHMQQIVFGSIVAIISIFGSFSIFNAIDPLIFALLITNLLLFRFR